MTLLDVEMPECTYNLVRGMHMTVCPTCIAIGCDWNSSTNLITSITITNAAAYRIGVVIPMAPSRGGMYMGELRVSFVPGQHRSKSNGSRTSRLAK
jgi:hypothetical protein